MQATCCSFQISRIGSLPILQPGCRITLSQHDSRGWHHVWYGSSDTVAVWPIGVLQGLGAPVPQQIRRSAPDNMGIAHVGKEARLYIDASTCLMLCRSFRALEHWSMSAGRGKLCFSGGCRRKNWGTVWQVWDKFKSPDSTWLLMFSSCSRHFTTVCWIVMLNSFLLL